MAPINKTNQIIATDRDRAKRTRADRLVRATALGPVHPAVEAAAGWLALRASGDTVLTSVANIAAFFEFCARGNIEPFEATRHDALVYLAEQRSVGYAPATVALRITIIRSFLDECCADPDIPIAHNPFDRIKAGNSDPVTPTPAMTLEECGRLADTCRRGLAGGRLIDQRNGAMAYLMIRVGPRRMEVASGTWGSLVYLDGTMGWRIHGKGDRWDTTMIPVDASDILEAWKVLLEAAIGRPVRRDEPIFPAFGHLTVQNVRKRAAISSLPHMSSGVVSEAFKSLLTECGIEGPRFNAHTARATAATQAYAATKDLVGVQRMLRLRNQATTLRYIRTTGEASPAMSWTPPGTPEAA